jgi:tetratricopeptide (TPR) repeat protein
VKRALLLFLVATAAGCTTPLAVGERLYREGDRLGALETWRGIPEDSSEYDESQQRIAVVEEEFNRLVERYKQRARYFEEEERLAESILDYRLALKLQPDDADTLAHVQQLARTVASRKAELKQQYDGAFGEGVLAAARKNLDQLRALDPFDPELQTDEIQLNGALRLAVERGLEAGQRQFMLRNHTDAERHFRSVLALDPDNEYARGLLSYNAEFQRDREATAERSATFATKERFAPEAVIRAEGFYQNARKQEQAGNRYEAIRLYELALEANPKHRGAHQHLNEMRSRLSGGVDALIETGREFYRNEELSKALVQWERALRVDPDNKRARAYVDRAERQIQNLERLRSEPDEAGRGQ